MFLTGVVVDIQQPADRRIDQVVLCGPSSSADSEAVLELLLPPLFLPPSAVALLRASAFLRESFGALDFEDPPYF